MKDSRHFLRSYCLGLGREDMEVQQLLHMNAGNGEISYATNSSFQKLVISKAKTMVSRSILDLYTTTLPPCLRIADLGCSSGPNTLLVIAEIIEAIEKTCLQLNRATPEFQVFLNDLSTNDFNTIFKTLPVFHEQLKKEKGEKFGPCSIAGLPGSFYERLFPSNSIHFFHSSNGVHWLSQVPQMVENNKGNIYLARTTPSSVLKAYLEQFQKDFSLFLGLRSKEITPGRMVLSMLGRRSEDPFGKETYHLELLSKSLTDLVSEGLIEEAKVDSFNLPLYFVSRKELEAIVSTEGSFYLDQLQIFDVNLDASDDDENKELFDRFIRGLKVANSLRAVTESMLACHFGDAVMDVLFKKFMEYFSDHLSTEEGKTVIFAISLIGK